MSAPTFHLLLAAWSCCFEVEVFTLSKVEGMRRGDDHVDHVKKSDELYVSALKHVPHLVGFVI